MKTLIEKANALIFLHQCELEGFEMSQPTGEQWYKAVNELREAINVAIVRQGEGDKCSHIERDKNDVCTDCGNKAIRLSKICNDDLKIEINSLFNQVFKYYNLPDKDATKRQWNALMQEYAQQPLSPVVQYNRVRTSADTKMIGGVCEWKMNTKIVGWSECLGPVNGFSNVPLKYKYCPFCGKPIERT